MNPRLINDLSKVVNGVSFVAKEAIKRSEIPNQGPTDILKSLVKTTAAICGLTRGNIHHFHEHHQHFTNPNLSTTNNAIVDSNGNNIISSDSKPNSSIVYFDNNADSSVSAASSSSIPPEISESHDAVLVSPNVDVTAAAEEVVISLAEANTRIEGGNRTGEVAAPLKRRKPRERKVPSTRFSRAFGFASLGAGLAWGAAQESAKRLIFGRNDSLDKHSSSSAFLSDKNAERLAFALCRMRGAALKIGQMLSIQDESLVPAPLLAALEIVRQGADVMPRSQINKVLDAELGLNWSSNLNSFNYEPMAAASIGQVHQAITRDGLHVAVKIQYPGVADSIESDIDNLKLLDDTLGLVPKGLYLDRVVEVAKEELSRECDYELEAMSQTLFRSLFADKEGFYVPLVVEELSSKRILTTELVSGIPIDKVAVLDQETRNYVGRKLLELTLMELFVFRFMQTDPNWSNYLYDEPTRIINLIDFGAARKFPKTFVDDYLRMVIACANCDRDAVIEMSLRLGFLSGMESDVMLDAHVQAGFVVGVPFSKAGGFDFRSTNITQSLANLGATMLKHRLTPPPAEAYSLHRKLSGAFLACIKLGSVVPCRQLLYNVYEHYNFGEDNAPQISSTDAV